MKKSRLLFVLFLVGVLYSSLYAVPPKNKPVPPQPTHTDWGFFGHKRINRMAVFTLPPEMIGFYKQNIEYITAHAVDPDKRRYATKLEAFRHYIDADHWGVAPFPNLPRRWTDALLRYTDISVVTAQNDTLTLFGNAVASIDTLQRRPANRTITLKSKAVKRIFGQDSLVLNYQTYRNFFHRNVESQYYDEAFIVSPDSLATLFPFKGTIPRWKAVVVKDHLTEYGIAPYHLEFMQRRLTDAFKERNSKKILRLSAEIGHYIGDCHVPLHTTENYNGQFTNQVGIHGFWESRIPELFADLEYDYFTGKADYLPNFHTFVWKTITDSHALLDSVLVTEKNLTATVSQDKQQCYEERLGVNVLVQCKEFARAWQTRLNGMVETRLRASIRAVGCAWYTAWIDAGQPDLSKLDAPALTPEEQAELDALEEAAKGGSLMQGRQE